MQSARGRTLLFADADGATKFQDIEKLETVLHFLAAGNYKALRDILYLGN